MRPPTTVEPGKEAVMATMTQAGSAYKLPRKSRRLRDRSIRGIIREVAGANDGLIRIRDLSQFLIDLEVAHGATAQQRRINASGAVVGYLYRPRRGEVFTRLERGVWQHSEV